MDNGTLWDEIVQAASRRRPESTPAAATTALELVPEVATRAESRHYPRQPRSVALIAPPLRQAIRECVAGAAPWPLFVGGPCGTGKTCAALALLDHVPGGQYHTAGGLCELLVRAQQGRLESYHEGRGGTVWPEHLWRGLAKAPLVVLDELGGRERVSDHHYDAVKRLLDERHGLPLVLLSNHDLAALARLYDDRIASRIGGGTVAALGGPDRRLLPRQQTA